VFAVFAKESCFGGVRPTMALIVGKIGFRKSNGRKATKNGAIQFNEDGILPRGMFTDYSVILQLRYIRSRSVRDRLE
jgi:hypothetical protein